MICIIYMPFFISLWNLGNMLYIYKICITLFLWSQYFCVLYNIFSISGRCHSPVVSISVYCPVFRRRNFRKVNRNTVIAPLIIQINSTPDWPDINSLSSYWSNRTFWLVSWLITHSIIGMKNYLMMGIDWILMM